MFSSPIVEAKCARAARRAAVRRAGFTLVELMTVVAVIGVLMSLLLAAVQACRESARRLKCANNMRNQVVALTDYCAARGRFPPGRAMSKIGEHSWCFELLPYLEQSALYGRFDQAKPWQHPRNLEVANASLAVFRCPSAIQKFPGKTDYAGILGSLLPAFAILGQDNDNGVMIEVGSTRRLSVSPGEITDGTSHTILIAECSDREADWGGRWISGYNCSSQNNGGINDLQGGDIHSLHPTGAYVGFADGRIQFLPNSTSEHVLGAICTRGGGELIDEY